MCGRSVGKLWFWKGVANGTCIAANLMFNVSMRWCWLFQHVTQFWIRNVIYELRQWHVSSIMKFFMGIPYWYYRFQTCTVSESIRVKHHDAWLQCPTWSGGTCVLCQRWHRFGNMCWQCYKCYDSELFGYWHNTLTCVALWHWANHQ